MILKLSLTNCGVQLVVPFELFYFWIQTGHQEGSDGTTTRHPVPSGKVGSSSRREASRFVQDA